MDSFTNEFEHLKISLEEIKRVANDFTNKPIGSGGFGKVYEGELSHSKGRSLVAIKRLDRKFGQGDPEFWKEIMMLTRYSHENLISLLGFCDEAGEKVIVYELASNGSLDRYLSSPDLTWVQRIKICLGAAKGLSYLHDDKGTQQRVIHRDVKSSNILLDDQWNAKVSDMGLSKLGPANQEHTALFTNVVGTLGYLDPVYLHKGVLTKESDVYSFGVVLFEVLCGRLCFSNGNLVPTWKQSYRNKKIHEIIFQDLAQPMEMSSLETFSNIAFQCVQESREKRPTMSHVVKKLGIALQFQQHHHVKLPEEYVNILKAVATPLRYKSVEKLKLLLSSGVLLDAGKTWFSINDKEERSVLISIDACLIREAGKDYKYSNRYKSRFPVGTLSAEECEFKTCVRTQFLSPNITYIVSLVYKTRIGGWNYHGLLDLEYKLDGETKTWTSYLADKREDGWYMADIYQFTSDGTPVHLDINFEGSTNSVVVEGIEFRPMENVEERKVSDDEKQVDMQPALSYLDDNTYWEQKLPNDYQHILKLSKNGVKWKTKKELYSIFCQGFLINYGFFYFLRLFNNGKQWFSLDKNGKKCLMVSARAAFKADKYVEPSWVQSDDSRFAEVLMLKEIWGPVCQNDIRYQVLSPRTKYACYLVYRLPEDLSTFEMPMNVCARLLHIEHMDMYSSVFSYIYLVSPQTPVIRPKAGQNTHIPLNRPKLKGIPQRRSDLWMEVQVYEFQTDTMEGVIPGLELSRQRCPRLAGLVIQGVEVRPI